MIKREVAVEPVVMNVSVVEKVGVAMVEAVVVELRWRRRWRWQQ